MGRIQKLYFLIFFLMDGRCSKDARNQSLFVSAEKVELSTVLPVSFWPNWQPIFSLNFEDRPAPIPPSPLFPHPEGSGGGRGRFAGWRGKMTGMCNNDNMIIYVCVVVIMIIICFIMTI